MDDKMKNVFLKKQNTQKILIHPEYLSESYIPPKLLFREREVEEIAGHSADFLFSSIVKNIVIHGPPGVGKTVAVRMLEKTYNEIATEQGITSRAVYVSAKDLTYRRTLYELAQRLGLNVNLGMSIADIYGLIVNHMTLTDSTYLLIIDEIDKLRKRPGEDPVDNLVYSLSRINERAGRIAVSVYLVTNNARVVERLSAPSFSSLAPIFIYFRAYNADELYEILRDRVEKAFIPGAVEDAALKLLAALIKRESRDLRWGFLVLREAATVAKAGKITEDSIWRAAEIVERNVLRQIIGGLDVDGLLLLLALALLNLEGHSRVDSSSLYIKYRDLCDSIGWNPRTMKHTINYIGAKLESEGLITRRPVSRGRYGRTHLFHLEEDASTVKNIVVEVLAERFNIHISDKCE
ncbi:Cdc6/Cdc18 family protein [Thermococcus prieurii]